MRPLRVMSWNIGQAYSRHSALLKRLPFLNKGVLPNKYLPFVAKTIGLVRPHVVCLQEVRSSESHPEGMGQLELLEKQLKRKYVGYYGPDSNDGEHRALLVSRKFTSDNGFKIEEIHAKDAGVGIATYVSRKDTWVANIHLDYDNLDLRQRQFHRMLDWMKRKKAQVILGGDYNMRRRYLLSPKHRNTVHNFFEKIRTHRLRDATKGVGATFLWKNLGIQLDYFLTNVPQKKRERTYVLEKRWNFMDHYPVVGEFFLKKKLKIQQSLAKSVPS